MDGRAPRLRPSLIHGLLPLPLLLLLSNLEAPPTAGLRTVPRIAAAALWRIIRLGARPRISAAPLPGAAPFFFSAALLASIKPALSSVLSVLRPAELRPAILRPAILRPSVL